MSLLDDVRHVVESASEVGLGWNGAFDLRPIFTDLMEDSLNHDDAPRLEAWASRIHREWLERGRLVAFARELEREVRTSFPAARGAERIDLLRSAAVLGLHHELEVVSVPLTLAPMKLTYGRLILVRQASERAIRASDRASRGVSDAMLEPIRYAEEVGLVSEEGVTSAGGVFKRLRGREAVKWLLALEAARASGPNDPWRMSTDTAAYLLRNPSDRWDCSEGPEVGPPFSWETILRLSELGILSVWDGHHEWAGYDLNDAGREILTELTQEQRTPLVSLAHALAADLTAFALAPVGELGAQAARATVEEATSYQARVLAHELRNKLVPVKEALETVFAELDPERRVGFIAKAMATGEAALKEVFQFIAATARFGEGLTRPQEWFALGQALDDAVASGRNGRIDAIVTVDEALRRLELRANRERFVNAIANLIRNGVQNGPVGTTRLEVSGTRKGDAFVLNVDDNGPGIPEALQSRVFELGFTTRAAGSGFGLDFVKRTVEGELEGRVDAGSGPLGGARVRVTLPSERVRTTVATELERAHEHPGD